MAATATHQKPVAYRVNDFCAAIGIGRSKLYALAKEGKIKLVKVGGRTVVPATEADRLVAEGAQ
jgi:excisionase family DNA binding protein